MPATDSSATRAVRANEALPPIASSPPLSRYLVLLLAAAILPLLLVASVLIWHQAVDQRADTERALLATAQATSLALCGCGPSSAMARK